MKLSKEVIGFLLGAFTMALVMVVGVGLMARASAATLEEPLELPDVVNGEVGTVEPRRDDAINKRIARALERQGEPSAEPEEAEAGELPADGEDAGELSDEEAGELSGDDGQIIEGPSRIPADEGEEPEPSEASTGDFSEILASMGFLGGLTTVGLFSSALKVAT